MTRANMTTYLLENGEERALLHPDTFTMPPAAMREKVQVGDFAKLIFLPLDPQTAGAGGERMWVIVTDISQQDFLVGELNNVPVLFDIALGSTVYFRAENIVDIQPG